MCSRLGLAFFVLFCLGACGGNVDGAPPVEAGGSGGVDASTQVVVVSAAGAAGANSGEAGAPPVENNRCDDAPAVVGCGCPLDPTPPPEVWSCIECDSLPSTSAWIGAEGGSFTLRGEGDRMFVLTIPPNALTAPTTIRVAESVRPPVGLMPVSAGYSIEPKGIEFAVPASVVIPVAANQQATGFYWSPDVCSEPSFLLKDEAVSPNSLAGTITRSGVVFATARGSLP